MTARDNEIFQILTHRVRVLSLEQIASKWWRGNRASARRRLLELAAEDLLRITTAMALPSPALDAPSAIWRPGEPEPDFGALSYRLRSRWKDSLRRTTIATATERAVARFGGFAARMPRASELSHDIALAEVYIGMERGNPKRASAWRSEAELYARGEGDHDKLPDAMIVSRSEKTVIEFGGAYPKAKLLELHKFCVARQWAYEVW